MVILLLGLGSVALSIALSKVINYSYQKAIEDNRYISLHLFMLTLGLISVVVLLNMLRISTHYIIG